MTNVKVRWCHWSYLVTPQADTNLTLESRGKIVGCCPNHRLDCQLKLTQIVSVDNFGEFNRRRFEIIA